MKEYLLLFWNEEGNGQYAIPPQEMKSAMEVWQGWIGNIALQGRLISTKPIQYEGMLVSQAETFPNPAIKEKMMVTGYLICKAENAEEVHKWAVNCPILHYPKGQVEIREVSPFEL